MTRVVRRPLLLALLVLAAMPLLHAVWDQGIRMRGGLADASVQAQAPVLSPGDIVLRLSGGCGTGFTEVAGLNGRFLLGTVAANANQGGTGGIDTITPEGTASFTGAGLGTHSHGTGTYATSAHSGAVVADHASHTHTYTQVPNHVHTLATGTGSIGNFSQVIGTVDASSGGTGGTPTQTALGTLSGNPTGGVATGTSNGPDAPLTHAVTQPSAHTLSGSSEAVTAGTPTGTVGFTGTPFDNRPAFARVIFCVKS